MIRMIAAIDDKGGIGKDGTIPWNCPEDLRTFKQLTSGGALVYGRKTWESLGKPLPNRQHFVIKSNGYTTQAIAKAALDYCEVLTFYGSPQTALEAAKATGKEVWVIGGGQIYSQLLSEVDYLYLSHIPGDYDCDTFFPPYSEQFEFIKEIEYSTHTVTVHERKKEKVMYRSREIEEEVEEALDGCLIDLEKAIDLFDSGSDIDCIHKLAEIAAVCNSVIQDLCEWGNVS